MMNNKKRRQLIGFITLILFVLLIAPYVITDKSHKTIVTIPLLQTIDTEYTHQEDKQIDIIDETNDADNETVIADNTTEQFDKTPPIDDPVDENNQVASSQTNQQTTKSYTIQLVALKNKQKIEELVALLRLSNYDVYTQPEIPQEGQITRLMVGNYPTEKQAKLVSMELSHLTKLNGIIIVK